MNNKPAVETSPGFVELQLLRHGPPHNQLLSPLTEYLALCGDHPNTTLRIPLEHAALETRLRALRYFDSEETRVDQLRETARIASELFAKVPGLIADLASHRADAKPFVHFSIASRAAELALFPFELALAPDGFPGAGQPLCLQKQFPVCLTRRSRNVRNDHFDWNRSVKILMIASNSGGDIPARQHFALLRKLVEPWVGTMPSDGEDKCRKKRRTVLRLLTQATVTKIESALIDEVNETNRPFTHIHILAHGCDLPESDRRSGLALHHPDLPDQIDAVDGKRLAAALGCLPDYPASSKRYCGPTAVTLATCSSAEQGGVTIPGASLAFELHDSGVPLVVGSQFPLSVDGSLLLTEVLYRGFLAGRDPRSTIWEARRTLKAGLREPSAATVGGKRAPHDWASMTVYTALPEKLDEMLPAHRRRRQQSRMDVRLRNINGLLDDLVRSPPGGPDNSVPSGLDALGKSGSGNPQTLKDLQPALSDADKAMQKFDKWVQLHGGDDDDARVSNLGILASAQKQVGLLYLNTIGLDASEELSDEQKSRQISWTKRGESLLHRARETYFNIFRTSRDESWALVQCLALSFALQGKFDESQWTMARELAELEEHSQDLHRRVWALSALLELQFLSWLNDEQQNSATPRPECVKYAEDLADRIRDHFQYARREVFSANRQFGRYLTDFDLLARASRRDPHRKHYLIRRNYRRSALQPTDVSEPSKALAAIRRVLEVFDDLDMSEETVADAD